AVTATASSAWPPGAWCSTAGPRHWARNTSAPSMGTPHKNRWTDQPPRLTPLPLWRNMPMTQRASWLELSAWLGLATLAALPPTGCSQSGNNGAGPRDPAVLNVALLPDEAAAKIIQDNQGLKNYLEQRLGKPVKLHVLMNYAAMIESVRAKNIDLA